MTNKDFLTPSEEQNIHSLAHALPFIDLTEVYPLPETIDAIPYAVAKNQGIVCIAKDENGAFEVACAKPNVIDPNIWNSLGKPTVLYQADETEVHTLLDKNNEEKKGLLSSRLTQLIPKIRSISDFGTGEMTKFLPKSYLQEIAHDVASERFWDTIFAYAESHMADEILFDTTSDLATISIMNNKNWEEIASFSKERNISLAAKLRLWADINQAREEEVLEGNFSREVNGESYLYKITIIKTQEGNERILIENMCANEGVSKLCLNSQQQYNIKIALKKNTGIILVSGKKGSGKTYSFYALLEEVEQCSKTHTIEEMPVELDLLHTAQSRLGNKAHALLQTLVKTKTQVVGIRPMLKNLFTHAWYASHTSLVISEIEHKPIEFLEHLNKEGIPTENLSVLAHSMLHSYSFKKMGSDTKTYKLDSSEKQSLLQFFSEKNLAQLFSTAGLGKELLFHTTTRGSARGLSSFFMKAQNLHTAQQQNIYIHGYVNLSEVIQSANTSKVSKLELQHMLDFAQKKAILENALIACAKQEVDIKDIINYIRS